MAEVLSAKELDRLKDEEAISTSAPRNGTRPWTNPRTDEVLDIPKGIDPGFAYNPGEALWGRQYALTAMEKAEAGQWAELDPWPPAAYDRPAIVPADIPVANMGSAARTEAALRAELRAAIGGDDAFFTNPVGETVMVNQAIVDHMIADASRIDGRQAYFNFIPELIENPFEIWIAFSKNESTGMYGIREKYVKMIQVDKKTSMGLVAETTNGMWSGFTFFRGREGSIDDMRRGRLLWGR